MTTLNGDRANLYSFIASHALKIIGILIIAVVALTYGSINADIADQSREIKEMRMNQSRELKDIKAEVQCIRDMIYNSVLIDTVQAMQIRSIDTKLKEHCTNEKIHTK